MTGVTLKINLNASDLSAQAGLGPALERLRRQAENLRPALHDIGEYLLESSEDRFDAQVDSAGRPWAPLSPGYKKQKRRHQDLILVLDGYLKGTLAKRISVGRLEIGSNRVYAATHQLGDERVYPRACEETPVRGACLQQAGLRPGLIEAAKG